MLPSSVRRVVATAPSSSAVLPSLASSAPRAATAACLGHALRPNGHQRRYSSSKPSSPGDGPHDYAARPSVPASGGSKASGEKRKRKAKEAAAPLAPQLPSVPSTRHIKDEAIALSTFFALHRPISVTQLLPSKVTDNAFAEIFNQRTRGHRVEDVMSTLSQTVHDLEQPLSKLSLGDKQDADVGLKQVTYKRADGTEKTVSLHQLFDTNADTNTDTSHWMPYTPPPPPQPLGMQSEAEKAAAAEEMDEPEPQTRIYRAMVTIEETVGADGEHKVVAHSPQLVEDEQPRSFLERMALRQMRWEDARQQQDRTMHAMSVKRIRKLKMKKKKYKKLMRRTRNERRKQDRL
ncbi:hypothetical protein QBC47DRAFT_375808 [Echria macrotheca]|uniref:Small ribosomal subunit protein mS38 n=1 Tax=Echria macrotheca TaxID=438768 RepID=A0AAJ0BK50_9PEZI|nr:hypothetical protein QBC47DRAFT_375808 [Echria macrotheca]